MDIVSPLGEGGHALLFVWQVMSSFHQTNFVLSSQKSPFICTFLKMFLWRLQLQMYDIVSLFPDMIGRSPAFCPTMFCAFVSSSAIYFQILKIHTTGSCRAFHTNSHTSSTLNFVQLQNCCCLSKEGWPHFAPSLVA